MFKSYLKIALRNLKRQKVHSFINIAGLAIGMACTILIALWVQDEMSYDRFHENAKNIYRIVSEWKEDSVKSARTPGLLAAAIQEQIPEIVHVARIIKGSKSAFKYGDKAFYEDRIFSVDPAFFDMFTFPFDKGNSKTALSEAHSLVITEEIARKYFGDEEPAGKILNWNNWQNYTVTGVLKNIPQNSHLQFDFLDSHQLGEKYWKGGYNWTNFIHETYVQLQNKADAQEVEQKITALLFKNSPQIAPYLSRLSLQPLSKIHLDAEITGTTAVLGDIKYVYTFSIVAFFILFIACVNFMNLSTARSINRTKEVGMRKVAGARRKHLVGQFFGESLFMTGLASVFAILLVEIFLPTFNYLSGKQLSLNYFDSRFYFGLILIVFMTGIISGLYPALYLSAFKPLAVLKGRTMLSQNRGGTGKGSGRKILVVVQFSLSIILIIAATVVYKQLGYMRNTKLGFDKENLIYLPAKENIVAKYEAVKNELLQNPNIQAVTAKGSLPMFTLNHSTVDWEGKKTPRKIAMENSEVDYNYFDILNLEFVVGRNFSKAYPTDATDAFIVNEEAVKTMGLHTAVGKRIKVAGKEGVIIGVVKNAHFKSLHHEIHPQVFCVLTDFTSNAMNLYGIILIKIQGSRIVETIVDIENIWKKVNPNSPFEYHFLDQTIDNQYNAEKKISEIMNYSTFLAVFISSLGLFGLASYTAEQRTKEIGIRKVLGASVSGIVLLLNKEFTKWVLVANLIAWPIAYIAMNTWIQNFAYRIKIGPGIFLISGVIALVIALLTVSTHAIKAAFANPTDSLRYE